MSFPCLCCSQGPVSYFSDESTESSLPSDARDKDVLDDAVYTENPFNKLSNDLLHKFMSSLSIKETVRTGSISKRWVNVWKDIPHLSVDLREFSDIITLLTDRTHHHAARSMTKVINDHHGHLERCTISYFSFQCRNGMVEDWIRPLIHVHHVKHLTVVNSLFSFCGNNRPLTLNLPPETFSHPNLQTLILDQYNFETPDAFNNCGNLKTLTLAGIFAEIGALNAVLVSCPSLEVLVVDISKEQGLDLLESSSEKKRGGVLRIENRNLVCLYLSCPEVDGIHVSSPNLDVLTIEYVSCEIEKFVIANPRLQFSRNFWTTAKVFPHTSHCISCPHQEKKNIGHELLMGGQFMMSGHGDFVRRFGSLSVSVDLTNAKEVKMLQEILVTWPGEMDELEILFMKSNAPSKEVESSSGGTQETFWEETKPFFSAKFFVFTVWLSNFSGSKEEFALASRLITQGTVIMTMIIKPSSFLPSDMLVIEEAVAKLKELQGFPDLSIRMG